MDTKSKTGFEFAMICLDDDCNSSELKIKIYSEKQEVFSIQVPWDEVLLIIENLTHMTNIHQIRKISKQLEKVESENTVNEILSSWDEEPKNPISHTEWHINRDEMAQDVRNTDAHKKDLAD